MVPSAHPSAQPKWHFDRFSSVQLFLQGSRLWQINRLTDRRSKSVRNNRPHLHLHSSEMRANKLWNIVATDDTNQWHNHNHFMVFFRDHPGEPVPEENFWTLWCKGRLTEADTNHLAWRHSIRNQPVPTSTIPPFFTGRMPFLPPNQQCQSTEGLAHSD